MSFFRIAARAALLAPLLLAAPGARAGVGDLLVAPTRVVLNGSRGTEIILNNIGDDVATYRISVELRRMKSDGALEDVSDPNAEEKLAESMIVYAPRRVTLAPQEPQTVRISARAPKDLPDGEYRVHLLFRAVPPPAPVEAPKEVKGIAFKLTTVYGVTIPVIARFGNLQAKAGIADVRLTREDGKPAVSLQLTRAGDRSTFGEVRVMKAGIKEPIAIQRGIAVYTEIGQRNVTIPIEEQYASAATGRVKVQYVEPSDSGPLTIAETDAVLN
jgi:P pilus assembly chaperone PapD